MPELDRAELLDLLGRLGAEDDATVLAAARELHGKLRESGLTWDELLQFDADRSDAGGDDGTRDAASATRTAGEAAGSKADVARLIERLLARPSISDTLREELVDFKRAIAEGTFEDMDAQYVRALAKRLGA
jgi:hypothetical protein